jgi:hypothetical protein
LGEIEATVRQHTAVAQAVVALDTSQPDAARVVAYLVPHSGAPVETGELRAFLRTRLPEYMVPSAFVLMSSLPLTVNGKVDRHALPLPELEGSETSAIKELPTEVEATVAAIWAKVLRRQQVGRHENFFALGGHSLSATQVISEVRSVLHREIPLRTIFEAPTVSEFCRVMAATGAETAQPEMLANSRKRAASRSAPP